MRTLRILLVGLSLVALSGCWWHHRPLRAHRFRNHCCPPPHCACYLGTPVPVHGEPPLFVAPHPGK